MAFEWAKIGAKCVCIDSSHGGFNYRWKFATPVVGDTYTISGFTADKNRLGKICLLFEEADNGGYGYAIHRFRPLVTEKDDVELFRYLLSPSPLERLDLLAERLDEIYNADAG